MSTKLLVAFVLISATAHAQIGTASISGTVTDTSQSVVPGVAITLTHTATGTVSTTVTNNAGFYIAPSLPVGAYAVTAEAKGFKKSIRTGITLEVGDHATVDFSLEIGSATETLQVTAAAPLVDTSSATVGKAVETTSVLELPLNGRNTMSLIELTPNARTQATAPAGFADRGFAVSAFSINGGPSGLNELIVDGTTNVNIRQGDVNSNLSADAIQEFRIQSGTMPAEYGYTLGGVVNMVTKSGTNSLHGTLYEFLRNDILDARNFFAAQRNSYKYNQYGGTVGGPVIKNKLFYFGNLEQYNYASSAVALGTTPTVAERQGNFSTFDTAKGQLIPIYNPLTTAATGSGYTRTPFPNNIIPPSLLDKVAQNVMNIYPLPNHTPSNAFQQTNNFLANYPGYQTQRQEVVKTDYSISDKDSASFRYILDDSKNNNAGSSIFPLLDEKGRDDNYSNRNFNMSETHIFSSNLINQFHFGLLRNHFPFQSFDAPGTGFTSPNLGLPSNVPDIALPSFAIGTPYPTWGGGVAVTNGLIAMLTFQFMDSLTYIKGDHSIKIGTEWRVNRYFDNECQYCSGSFSFTSVLTGNPNTPAGTGSGLASFLLGDVASAYVYVNAGATMHNFTEGYYIQDDWKATRRLTLNLGLRWDYQQVPEEIHDGESTFDPNLVDSVNGLLGAMTYEGSGPDRFGAAILKPDYRDWSPRFGFAYDVFGTGRTVIRGGYGIYYGYTFPYADAFGSLGFKLNETTYAPPGNNPQYPAFMLQNGFPTNPIQPLGAALGSAAFLGQSVNVDEANGRTPYSQQFSFTIQHQLPYGLMLETGYEGNKGTHLRAGSYNLNELNPSYLSLGNALNNLVPNPYAGMVPGPLGGPTITLEQSLLPYPYYNQIIDENPHLGSSIYHSLIITMQKRYASGFVILSSFTWGKSISDGVSAAATNGGQLQVSAPATQTSAGNVYQNGLYDLAASRSIDADDTARRWVTSLVYELPFGKDKRWRPSNGFVNTLVSGWQLNTVMTFESGLPLLITGANNQLATRPNSTGVSAQLAHPTISEWFNTQVFINPPAWTFGNVSVTLPNVRGPGLESVDMSISKLTAIRERFKLQIRGEAFNMPNIANFLQPNTAFVPGTNGYNSSSTFGTITTARDPRVIQVAVKLIF